MSRYARWLGWDAAAKLRRETWAETVQRYMDYMQHKLGDKLSDKEYRDVHEGIFTLTIVPSMRLLMTAGPAAEKCNVAAYNCAFAPIEDMRVFDEILYILMCGTGVGFSVERQFISGLPCIAEHFEDSDTIIHVADSKAGWARALKELIALLTNGQIPQWDTSAVRPAGAPLKVFGGRASGPAPLELLFKQTVNLFRNAAGRKLTSVEAHDLVCFIAGCVVVGGVRRSALLSLSNLSDDRMRHAKSGNWYETEAQRGISNNSAAYTERPDAEQFLREWTALIESKSGERGIFNRKANHLKAMENGRRITEGYEDRWGTNPCSEIILKPYQFCNLTEVIVRPDMTGKDLRKAVRLATIVGTYQATLTDFKYLRKKWKKTTEEDRLLGVSLTGVMDHPVLSNVKHPDHVDLLHDMRATTVRSNEEYAIRFGIECAAAITCIKPSGTVSQLAGTASGMHARFAPYYMRRIRADRKDPLAQFMQHAGVPCEPEGFKEDAATLVFTFPQKSPAGAVTVKDQTAVEQLELWLSLYDNWCEHKPSITVYVKDEEWMEVGAYVYKHFDKLSGVAFLPVDGAVYQQMPYEEIDEATYHKLVASMPTLDWSAMEQFEKDDATTGSQELACSAGACEITSL